MLNEEMLYKIILDKSGNLKKVRRYWTGLVGGAALMAILFSLGMLWLVALQ